MSHKIFLTATVLVANSIVGVQSTNAQSFSVGGFAGAQVDSVGLNNGANSSITVVVTSPSSPAANASISGSSDLFGASAQAVGSVSVNNGFSSGAGAGASAFSQSTNFSSSKFTSFPGGATASSIFFRGGTSFNNGFTNFAQ